MSSSSSSTNYLEPVSHCDRKPPLPAKERVSRRRLNPARRFFNCFMSLIDPQSMNNTEELSITFVPWLMVSRPVLLIVFASSRLTISHDTGYGKLIDSVH
ncbi:hypothetical protein LXL04_033417 [Taraxacum kok-saghyz]